MGTDDRAIATALASEQRRWRVRTRLLLLAAVCGAALTVGGSILGLYVCGFGAVFLAVHLSVCSVTRRARTAAWRVADGEVWVGPGIGARRVVEVRFADGTSGELRRGHTYSPMGSYSGRLLVSVGRPQMVVVPGNSRVYQLVNAKAGRAA